MYYCSVFLAYKQVSVNLILNTYSGTTKIKKILTAYFSFRNSSCLYVLNNTKNINVMNNSEYNKAENAVDNTKDSLKGAANDAKWKVEDLADRAKEYINEKRNNDEEARQEDWLDRAKNNFSDTWEDVKDKANDAWEKTKDAAEDVKAEWNKKTN